MPITLRATLSGTTSTQVRRIQWGTMKMCLPALSSLWWLVRKIVNNLISWWFCVWFPGSSLQHQIALQNCMYMFSSPGSKVFALTRCFVCTKYFIVLNFEHQCCIWTTSNAL